MVYVTDHLSKMAKYSNLYRQRLGDQTDFSKRIYIFAKISLLKHKMYFKYYFVPYGQILDRIDFVNINIIK